MNLVPSLPMPVELCIKKHSATIKILEYEGEIEYLLRMCVSPIYSILNIFTHVLLADGPEVLMRFMSFQCLHSARDESVVGWRIIQEIRRLLAMD
ncbi:unnamed protein product [Trifolium pratense]|uniref:Uncharacterized protein n=1 Tax=Trifolium pratense TaxID=57577 RepID=A0ACB0LQQ1_TRIPR|nr:unnamed protein product [Trifolium pratense]